MVILLFLAQIFINCFFLQPFCGFERAQRSMGEHPSAAVIQEDTG